MVDIKLLQQQFSKQAKSTTCVCVCVVEEGKQKGTRVSINKLAIVSFMNERVNPDVDERMKEPTE